MPVEIEAKMKLHDGDNMAALLKDRGAARIGEYLETNTFYDTDDRALLAAGEGLRLRIAQNLATGAIQCVLTHKGPTQYGPLKSREETELTVGSAEDAAQLLERLGFVRCLSFQKRRQSWQLEGCKVELDEVPHLGQFIEIEGPSEDVVMRLRDALGLGGRPLIKASYVAMLTAYLQERGEPSVTEIAFSGKPVPPVAKAG